MSKYKLHLSLAFGLIFFGVVTVATGGRAEAAAFSNSTSIPRFAIDAVEHNNCVAYGKPFALYQSSWISPPDRPKVTSTTPYIDVAKGQGTVHLWLNDLSAICKFGLKNGNVDPVKLGGIQVTQFNTVSASVSGANGATINALAGSKRRVSYGLSGYNMLYMTDGPPLYLPEHTDFNISNLQAINSTASKEYSLKLEVIVRPVHQYANGKFICVALGPGGKIETALDILGNQPGGKKCGTTSPDFNLKIKVADDPDRKPVGDVESTCSGLKITNFRDPDVARVIKYKVTNQTTGVEIVNNYNGGTVNLTSNSSVGNVISVRFFNYRADGTRDATNDYITNRTWIRPVSCPPVVSSTVSPTATATFNPDTESPTEVILTTKTQLTGVPFPHNITREYYVEKLNGTKQYISETAPNTVFTVPTPASMAPRPLFPAPGGTSIAIHTLTIATPVAKYTLEVGEKVCAKITVNPSESAAGSGPDDSTSCAIYQNKPFVSFYGGDVQAGGSFTGVGLCDNPANIATYNRTGSQGSGVQLAAFALGEVITNPSRLTGFTSARIRTAVPTPPKDLTFANTTTLNGQFGADHCIPDYYGDKVTSATSFTNPGGNTITPAALTAGDNYIRPSGGSSEVQLSGNLVPNQRSSVYIDGDLRITNNISYPAGSWSLATIPSLHIFVRGHIYINNNVQDITGMFVAQPDNAGNKGQILTCANPVGSGATARFATDLLWANCRTKLTIHGSFSAKQVIFDRVTNSLRDATNEGTAGNSKAAEVFDFSPEHYLVAPGSSTDTATSSTQYDFYTLLPPIL